MATSESYGKVKLKGMLLGDDNWATVVDEEPPYKNKKGIELKKYLIIPGGHLIKQFPELQKPEALPVTTPYGPAVWVEFPTYWIDDRNPSRTNAIVRVACAFDGRETLQTRKYKQFTDEIKMLQEEKENLEIGNMHLTEENNRLLGENKAMMKEYIEMANMNPGSRRYYDEQEGGGQNEQGGQ